MAENLTAPRMFTAERSRCRLRRAQTAVTPSDSAADEAAATHHHVELKPVCADATQSIPLEVATAESCDFIALQDEVQQLKEAIEQMKQEIASLHQDKPPAPTLQKATCELDAVVQATEDATHNILEAAEHIDTILMDIRGKADAAMDAAAIDQVGEQVIRIFESCNFQDITGQRINKVVNAMKFIEGRIDRMIEILGGSEALRDVEVPVEEVVDEDAKLLEGPQPEGESKISQNDIDRFFD